jgi:hypothetical protein
MERCLQVLDELDDFLIGLLQASMPWLAMLLAGFRGARSAVRASLRSGAGSCTRLIAALAPRRSHYAPQRFH